MHKRQAMAQSTVRAIIESIGGKRHIYEQCAVRCSSIEQSAVACWYDSGEQGVEVFGMGIAFCRDSSSPLAQIRYDDSHFR